MQYPNFWLRVFTGYLRVIMGYLRVVYGLSIVRLSPKYGIWMGFGWEEYGIFRHEYGILWEEYGISLFLVTKKCAEPIQNKKRFGTDKDR